MENVLFSLRELSARGPAQDGPWQDWEDSKHALVALYTPSRLRKLAKELDLLGFEVHARRCGY